MVETCLVSFSSEPCSSLEPGRSPENSVELCTSRDAVRQEGLPWVRLVLSLLLLGAPALALTLETAPDGPYLAGSFDQLTQGGCQKNGLPKGVHPLLVPQSKPLAQEAMLATPWRVVLRHLDAATRTLTQIHRWVQATAFSHGRVIDPAQYLQRTLR